MSWTKQELFEEGRRHIETWCVLNRVGSPSVDDKNGDPGMFGTCAYYRDGVIYIDVSRCAGIGMAGRAWSYPGYLVDRTPYGVLAHELGHHVEGAHGAAGGVVASSWRVDTGEAPITSYAPNDNEWFAEIFRLFVTNLDLLRALRPRMFAKLMNRWPKPAMCASWEAVLRLAPRQLGAARNKAAARAPRLFERAVSDRARLTSSDEGEAIGSATKEPT